MPFKFNPFTGDLDLVMSPGSGTATTSFDTDSGTAFPDGTGAILIAGGTALSTVAAANTVIINLTSPVAVTNGGTGTSSLTNGGIVLGSGTSPVTVTAQPTNGQLLIGSTGSDPVLSTLTAGTNVSIVNGAGTITINATSSGDVEGPNSSTDNAVVRWDGTGGDTLQDSSVIISDTDAVSGITQLNVDNVQINGNTISTSDTNGNLVLSPDGTGNVDASACGIIFKRRAVSSSDDVDPDDYYLGITSGTVTLTFDSADFTAGQAFVVKDEAGAAGTNNITLASANAETFDGNATYTINVDYGAVDVIFDGSDFFIF